MAVNSACGAIKLPSSHSTLFRQYAVFVVGKKEASKQNIIRVWDFPLRSSLRRGHWLWQGTDGDCMVSGIIIGFVVYPLASIFACSLADDSFCACRLLFLKCGTSRITGLFGLRAFWRARTCTLLPLSLPAWPLILSAVDILDSFILVLLLYYPISAIDIDSNYSSCVLIRLSWRPHKNNQKINHILQVTLGTMGGGL